MKPYDIYIFILCFIVFTTLTVLFTYLLYEIIKLTIQVIKHGIYDDKLIRDYRKSLKPKRKCKKIAITLFSIIFSVILLAAFGFSLWLHFSEDVFTTNSSLKVIASSSMGTQNKNNKYLVEQNLNNQLNLFDIIITHPKPDEFDLKLYDIIIYQYEDIYVIHRIVKIEEPNSTHPDHRLFITQGDAVAFPDANPVSYEQIKAIYYNEKIPFVGSFVFFMQSPAGWLCILLILYTIIITPIVENKIYKEIIKRLYEIDEIDEITFQRKIKGA